MYFCLLIIIFYTGVLLVYFCLIVYLVNKLIIFVFVAFVYNLNDVKAKHHFHFRHNILRKSSVWVQISDAPNRNFLSHVICEKISADAPLIHLHNNLTCVVSYNDRVLVALFVVLC